MTPVRRQVGTDHGRIFQFIDEAIRAGYPVVILAPDAMAVMEASLERMVPAASAFLTSVRVVPSSILSSGTALAAPGVYDVLSAPYAKVMP
jgi:hypothetical protein